MQMENKIIRNTAKLNGVKHWEIAEKIRITESQFSVMLRRELPVSEQEKILHIIEEIAKEKEAAENADENH